MSLLTLHNLTKSYGGFEVFQDLSGAIGVNERVALVGMNGAGKSTLLHIIAGTELPDGGELTLARGRRVGYLTQEVTFDPDSTLWEVMRAVFKDLEQLAAEMRVLEEQMSHAPADEHDAIFERYAELSHTFEARGGYEYENRIQRVLAGLGFTKPDYEMKSGMLSGGQRTRAALAQLILTEPDLLLLDEPTNHLDLNATEWLEEELLRWQGSLLVASHDRYFLDRIAQRVWELDWGKLEEYNGNYSHYVEQRAERHARRLQEYEDQQAEIAKTEEFVRKYGAGQRAREAKGREKRMLRIERLERPREHQRLKLRLGSTLRSGDIVLDSMGMLVGYPGKPLLRLPKFEIRRGDRVALIGPNGAGKTTLLRTIMGENKPLQGQFRTGAAVRTGYYAQGHEGLNPEQTVLDEILDGEKDPNLGQARSFLARFLFTGEDVYKRVGDLSGGERSRVALAKLAQHRSNFLILDEPTNHLDIPAQEELEDVLSNFDGTILFVSHDRYFIDELATQVWAVEPGAAGEPASLTIVRGGYAEYIEQRRGTSSAAQQKAVVPVAPQRPTQSNAVAQVDEKEARRRQRRVAAIETEITKLETRLAELTRLLDEASIAHKVAEVERLGREYAELEEQIAARFEEWSSLAEAIA